MLTYDKFVVLLSDFGKKYDGLKCLMETNSDGDYKLAVGFEYDLSDDVNDLPVRNSMLSSFIIQFFNRIVPHIGRPFVDLRVISEVVMCISDEYTVQKHEDEDDSYQCELKQYIFVHEWYDIMVRHNLLSVDIVKTDTSLITLESLVMYFQNETGGTYNPNTMQMSFDMPDDRTTVNVKSTLRSKLDTLLSQFVKRYNRSSSYLSMECIHYKDGEIFCNMDSVWMDSIHSYKTSPIEVTNLVNS